MKVIKYPDKRLHEKSKEVGFIWFLILRQYMPELIKFMLDNKGIGLAGVQVGILKRFFIMKYAGAIHVIYNPKILRTTKNLSSMQEGCLSLPDTVVYMLRSNKITVEYRNKDFEKVQDQLTGLNAFIFQHEYDHLEGKLITDKD